MSAVEQHRDHAGAPYPAGFGNRVQHRKALHERPPPQCRALTRGSFGRSLVFEFKTSRLLKAPTHTVNANSAGYLGKVYWRSGCSNGIISIVMSIEI